MPQLVKSLYPFTSLFFFKGSPFGWGIPVYWVWRKVHKSTLPCQVSPDGWKLIYLVFHWESCQKSNSYFFLDRLNQTIYLRKNVRQSTVYFHVSLYIEFDVKLRRMKNLSFLKKNDFVIHICHCVRRFSRCWRCPGEICDYHFLFSVL